MRRPPKYVQAFTDQHGHPRFYLRRRGHKKIPLPGLPYGPEFMEAYERALAGHPADVGEGRTKPGTINAAIATYYRDQSFTTLAPSTQKAYRWTLERFRQEHGEKRVGLLQRQHLVVLLREKKQFAARNWLKAIKSLMKFCVELGLRADDPTTSIKAKVKTDGHHSWSEQEIEQFQRRHGPETKARLALALLLYTGQRRGDVIRMGRQHIRDGAIAVRQQKTGTELVIPIHPTLEEIIGKVPADHLTLLTTQYGRPFTTSGFSNFFRGKCNEAGLQQCSAHGLRKAAARRLAEAGCSVHEIASITGHIGLHEVARYTKGADQVRLARAAMAKTRTP
jgi:integrase